MVLISHFDNMWLLKFFVGFSFGVTASFVIFFSSTWNCKPKYLKEEVKDLEQPEVLFNEVKVLCLIMTHPANHKTKAIYVKNTWGRRCNKLLFITTQPDPQLDTIIVNVTKDSRNALRNRTRDSFLHVHDTYLNDFDWFMKADDDNFVIMENLRYMLHQYNPNTALLFGHRFKYVFNKEMVEGYMAGGGYILSRKAVSKLVTKVRQNFTQFFYPDGPKEDVEMGRALTHSAIFVDCRDDKLQNRFVPISFQFLVVQKVNWFSFYTYYGAPEGLDCCSDLPISFHYIKPHNLYLLEFLVYKVQVFGLKKQGNETMPRKLSLQEIINASDAKGQGVFRNHEDYHLLEPDELY